MPPKKTRLPPTCELILLLEDRPIETRPGTNGLNRLHLRIVSWCNGEPALEYRYMFMREGTGEWVPRKQKPIPVSDLDLLDRKRSAIDSAVKAWKALKGSQTRGDTQNG